MSVEMTERHDVRTIRISVYSHKETGMMVAVSDDLQGLFVHGRSEDELVQDLPGAITELLEANGVQVVEIEHVREDPDFPRDFMPRPFIADAVLAAA